MPIQRARGAIIEEMWHRAQFVLGIAFLVIGTLFGLAATLTLIDGSVAPGLVLAACTVVLFVASRANWRDALSEPKNQP